MTRPIAPTPPAPADLENLLRQARERKPMTAAEIREQRISSAYGNAGLENPRVTRDMVEAEHDRLYGAPEAGEAPGEP